MSSSIEKMSNFSKYSFPANNQIISKGSYLARSIYWLRSPGCETVKKIVVVFISIILVTSLIGLLIFIPCLKEWNRQVKVQKEATINFKSIKQQI